MGREGTCCGVTAWCREAARVDGTRQDGHAGASRATTEGTRHQFGCGRREAPMASVARTSGGASSKMGAKPNVEWFDPEVVGAKRLGSGMW